MADNDQPLTGLAALITGSSGGIGAATAFALARAGADVALLDLHRDAGLEAKIVALNRKVLFIATDVCNPNAVEAAVNRTVAELGGLDILVTSAVYSDREPFLTADMDGFQKTIDVSFWGSFFALRFACRAMVKQGRGGAAVVVSSPQAVIPFPNCMAYNVAKAAQDQMARTAAMELLGQRIRVNILHPGWTDTPGERKYCTEDEMTKGGASLPAKRLARPDEIARGVLFLVDPASEYVNGITLSIDGGIQLPWWSKRGTGEI